MKPADGTQIAFTTTRDPGENWEIYVMDANGTGQTNLTNSAAVEEGPAWQPTCSLQGTAGPDTLVGTAKAELICGRGGNDTLRGGGVNDVVFGETGADVLFGGDGSDVIVGGPGPVPFLLVEATTA